MNMKKLRQALKDAFGPCLDGIGITGFVFGIVTAFIAIPAVIVVPVTVAVVAGIAFIGARYTRKKREAEAARLLALASNLPDLEPEIEHAELSNVINHSRERMAEIVAIRQLDLPVGSSLPLPEGGSEMKVYVRNAATFFVMSNKQRQVPANEPIELEERRIGLA